MHKSVCAEICSRNSEEHKLPFTCQVVRNSSGASIPFGKEDLIPTDAMVSIAAYHDEKRAHAARLAMFLRGLFKRADQERNNPLTFMRRLGGHYPCLSTIFAFVGKVANATKPRPTKNEVRGLHPCALAHLKIVRGLTEEQLAQRYPLACGERVGEPQSASMGKGRRAWCSIVRNLELRQPLHGLWW